MLIEQSVYYYSNSYYMEYTLKTKTQKQYYCMDICKRTAMKFVVRQVLCSEMNIIK